MSKLHTGTYAKSGEMGVLGLPLFQGDAQPESINAQGHNGEQPPLDPVAKQLDGLTIEREPLPVDHRVLDFPIVDQAAGPGVTNAQRANRNERAQQVPANQLEQSAIKIRIVHDFLPFSSRYMFHPGRGRIADTVHSEKRFFAA